MAGRIKGITVEIGGDTTGLEKALKGVNTTIKSTQTQLKDVNKLLNRFSGRLVKVICSEEPDMYAVGTLEAEPTYDPLTGKGQLVFSCEDGDAYRYHVAETSVSKTGSGQVALENDFMPVVPTVTTTADTAFSWKVGEDTFRKSVSAGTWVFPELELAHGENIITVSGSGQTTFTYREGRL